ncbi:PilN domain-containing protein [Tepidibacillus sp. HK-1]|uniref:PilN domain-containing protein n=1 Tax=Tepidibacillus sp. HK-1 TaxID=1883407 RepID=UPI00085605C2|nr:hypothetical protein [Tepidibacillus sp. HK-1]GBF10813.1 hypothetical protein HK1_00827 [Tepidibacillus sp. HK-1]
MAMEINLLPQVPTTKKFLWPIAVVIGLIVIVYSSFVGLQIWSKSNQLTSQTQILEQLKKERKASTNQLNQLRQERQLPALYLETIKQLDSAHINWISLVDEISKKLPKDGNIISMSWKNNGKIEMIGYFHSLERVGQYIQWLNQIEWIKEANFINTQETTTQETYIQDILVSESNLTITKEPTETLIQPPEIDVYQITIQIDLNLPSLAIKEGNYKNE